MRMLSDEACSDSAQSGGMQLWDERFLNPGLLRPTMPQYAPEQILCCVPDPENRLGARALMIPAEQDYGLDALIWCEIDYVCGDATKTILGDYTYQIENVPFGTDPKKLCRPFMRYSRCTAFWDASDFEACVTQPTLTVCRCVRSVLSKYHCKMWTPPTMIMVDANYLVCVCVLEIVASART